LICPVEWLLLAINKQQPRNSRQALLRQSWLTATLSMDQLADAQTDIAAAAASQITNWQSQ
jgi:hypothetical protein